jgi:hypothetical protein
MKNIQYNDIISAFKTFCDNHLQINQCVDAQTWDLESVENIFPSVIIVPTTSSVMQGTIQLSFEIFFVDILIADNSNGCDIYNDQLEICKDFIAFFTDNPDLDWTLSQDLSIQPIWEKFDDIVAGWVLSCNVEIPYGKGICEIPMK